jgi:hydroxymethylpyrimidine pyrophosphatase-like HAD family hydrolase
MTIQNTPSYPGIAISDLDGTLLHGNGKISEADLAAFRLLSERRIPRVIATGRSLFSTRRVLNEDFPIDYLVFSAGAGVMDWRGQKLLRKRVIPAELVTRTITLLKQLKLDFMVHAPIPDNHRFHWHTTGSHNPDFSRRLDLYRGYTEPLDGNSPGEACQLIAISPDNPEEAVWQQLREELAPLKIVRATSPLDDRSVWVEVYPPATTKSTACAWLAEQLDVPRSDTLALGNDYNDLDLLRWAGESYVVENAPEELRQEFAVVEKSGAGWEEAVRKWLGK